MNAFIEIKIVFTKFRFIIFSVFFYFFLTFYIKAPIKSFYIIDGYCNKTSYSHGEFIKFYTSGNGNNSSLQTLILFDNSGKKVTTIPNFFMKKQNINKNFPERNGFDYKVTKIWKIPNSIKSGLYYIKSINGNIPFIIKGKLNSDIVIVYPTNTDYAYLNEGTFNGLGMYGFVDEKLKLLRYNPIVSYMQPIKRTCKPDGFLNWIKSTNFNYTIISDKDLDKYSEISQSKLLIVIGHSEYWTRRARINFDRFVNEGKNAIILSGNTMWWQLRYENSKTTNPQLICFKGITNGRNNKSFDIKKYQSVLFKGINEQYVEDPIINIDSTLSTTNWVRPWLKYSVLKSIGSDFDHGGFAGHFAGTEYNGFSGYRVINPKSPFFKGVKLSNNFFTFDYENGTELDGVRIKGLNVKGQPNIDIKYLGFYKTELIAYDRITYHGEIRYSPLMVFQKKRKSGLIFNVNNNQWCMKKNWNKHICQITKNAIEIFLSRKTNVFSN